MTVFLLRRFVQIVLTAIAISAITFALLRLLPGDPALAIGGEGASPERLEAIRNELGLNDSFIEQYGNWLGGLFRGDLGTSFSTGASVATRIGDTLPVTLQLVGASLLLSLVFGLTLGVLAARRPGSVPDRAIAAFTTLGVSIPNFWLGMLLIVFVAVPVSAIPTFGFTPITDGLRSYLASLLLPAVSLSTVGAAEVSRQLRAALIEVQRSDHVRVARAKGLSERQVFAGHMIKNSLIPVVTVLGLLVNRLVGATVVIEAVFNIPGTGNLVANAAAGRDVPLLQGVILTLALLVLVVNLGVDLLYGVIDPRMNMARS